MIKPAYSFSFLLSINIFVWQNVLYFLDAPRIFDTGSLATATRFGLFLGSHCQNILSDGYLLVLVTLNFTSLVAYEQEVWYCVYRLTRLGAPLSRQSKMTVTAFLFTCLRAGRPLNGRLANSQHGHEFVSSPKRPDRQ